MKNPLLAPLIALISGILIAHAVPFRPIEPIVALCFLLPLALCASFCSRKLALFTTFVTLVFAGVLVDVLHRPGPPPQIDAGARETVLLSGCVVEPTTSFEGRDQFTLELAPQARARVTLTIPDTEIPPELSYGQNIEVEGRIRAIRNFQNPGAFDFAGFSAREHIYWTASARGANAVHVLTGRCGSRFQATISGLRDAAIKRIEKLYSGDPYTTGMMESILLADRSKLEKIWTDHFRRTGTFHALVIAGLHVSVLASLILFLFRVCLIPTIPALFLTALCTWLYALVAGAAVPVVRAAGGLTLYVFCRFFYRRARVINLMAALAILYLLLDPMQLFEAAFQLSFLSVAAIAAFAIPVIEKTSAPYAYGLRAINDRERDLHFPPKAAQFRVELRLLAETAGYYLRINPKHLARAMALVCRVALYCYEMAVISTVIQVGVALPMAIYFHRISFTGFSANLIVVPLLTLVVPVGFVAVFTNWHWTAAIAGVLVAAAEKVASWHVRFEPEWRVPNPPLWLCLAFIAALFALMLSLNRSAVWRYSSAAAVLILFAILFSHPFSPRVVPGQLELTAIDVGQGDGLFLAYPDGHLMLIDGGGIPTFGRKTKSKLDLAEDVVSPYLWSRSISHVDVIACTHAHEDHAGAVPGLIDNFHPRELWTGANPDSEAWREIEAHARRHGVKIIRWQAGQRCTFGGANIEVLSPPRDYLPSDTPKNDDSLAFRVTYRKRSFLLTGDMEKPMEARILEDGLPVRADVLKVGHHGSKTSSTGSFLDAVAPEFALISDGFENSFHHPHPEVLDRLEEQRARILRTDIDGLITVRSDGQRLWMSTFAYEQAAKK